MQINISIKGIILSVWVIFSVGYISWDLYSEVKLNAMKSAYTQWQTDVVTSLFKEVDAAWCQKPITVNLGAQKVDLVNMTCLQSKSWTWANAQNTTEPQSQPTQQAPAINPTPAPGN